MIECICKAWYLKRNRRHRTLCPYYAEAIACIVVRGYSGSTYSLPISNLYHRGGKPRTSRTVRRAIDWCEWAAYDGPGKFVRYEMRSGTARGIIGLMGEMK